MTGPRMAGGNVPSMVTVAPFWQEKPASGVDYYFIDTGILGAGAGSQLILGPAVKTQAGNRGVIASVTIFIDAITTAWEGIFSVRIAGGPVPGMDRLTSFPRVLSNISQPYAFAAVIPPGSVVDCLVINNGAGGPWTVGIELAGWQWPMSEEIRVFGRVAG